MSSIYTKRGWYWLQRYVKNPETNRHDKRVFTPLNTKDREEALILQSDDDKRYREIFERNKIFPMRPLSQCVEEYLIEKKVQTTQRKRSINTYRSDDITLHQFLAFMKHAFDDIDIREISKSHILQFKEYREADELVKSSSTVSLNLRVTRAFFSSCIEKGYIEHHPFERIKILKSLTREECPLDDDFMNLIKIFSKLVKRPFPRRRDISYGKHRKKEELEWIYDHEWFPYVIFIVLTTGMRIGEVLLLKWKQGKGDTGKGHSYSYSYLSKDLMSLTIHSKRRKRILPIEPLKPIFNKIPKTYNIKDEEKGEVQRKKVYVFENDRTHDCFQTTSAARLWKKFLLDYELNENWTIHSLRHGVASAFLNSGKTHSEAGAVLGHSTLEMVDRYQHATSTNMAETMSVLHSPKKKKKKHKKKPNE